MYLATILLLMVILPIGSVVIHASAGAEPTEIIALAGQWFVFWGVGVRLLTAGVRQVANPAFTAVDIFNVDDPRAVPIVKEIGFGNLSMGLLGTATIVQPAWIVPAAICGGLYLGLAGLGHVVKGERNRNETIAMISDLWIFAVLAVFLAATFLRG